VISRARSASAAGMTNLRNRWLLAADWVGVTEPRKIVPGEVYCITRRCSRREYLLRPDEETKAIFDYCLAEAAARFGIGLIAWEAMSNHYHAVVHDPKGCLPEFLEHLHKMVAKVMNDRWGRSENFWSSHETCVTRLVSIQDILEKVVYVLCNAVAADLVDHVHDWPGSSSLGYMGGKTTTHRRPKYYFRQDGAMPEVVTLRAKVPSRITKHESTASWWERVRKAVAEREKTLRERRAEKKRRVFGRKAIMRVRHTDAPQTPSTKGKLRPHIACKNKKRRIQELEALQAFRKAYREARESWAKGKRRVTFPFGTYRLLSLGVRCAASPAHALR
jgi:putative transposase